MAVNVLLRLSSRGEALVAELLRLSDHIPPLFALQEKQEQKVYGEVLLDFCYLKTPALYEHKIESSPDLIAKFMEKCALRTRRAPRACPRTTSHRTTHRRPPCARACSSCPPQDVEAPQAGGRHHDARRRAGLPPGAAPLAHL